MTLKYHRVLILNILCYGYVMCAASCVSVPTGLLLKTGLERREVTIRINTVITTEGDIWH